MRIEMNVEELKALWNKDADIYNQWDDLGVDEIVAFAQDVEREACAQLVEYNAKMCGGMMCEILMLQATAIRARSEKEDDHG